MIISIKIASSGIGEKTIKISRGVLVMLHLQGIAWTLIIPDLVIKNSVQLKAPNSEIFQILSLIDFFLEVSCSICELLHFYL
jgi:hypothetical protein